MSDESLVACHLSLVTGRLSFDDLWTPDQPLPDGGVLRELSRRVLAAWGHAEWADGIRFGYNGRLRRCLGRAFFKEGRIDLNPRLLSANRSQVIPTLVHELAHIVAWRLFGEVNAHGLHFRALMAKAGFKGRATVRLAKREGEGGPFVRGSGSHIAT